MRDPNRLDNFYEKLKEYHKNIFPDCRFIQLMHIFLSWHYNEYKTDGFYLEEDECLERFEKFFLYLEGGEK